MMFTAFLVVLVLVLGYAVIAGRARVKALEAKLASRLEADVVKHIDAAEATVKADLKRVL